MVSLRNIFYSCIAFVTIVLIIVFLSDSLSVNLNLLPTETPTYKSYLPVKDINDRKRPADAPDVIQILKQEFLLPPSNLPYNLSDPQEINPSMGQAQKIDVILKQMENGFFIECGALDGETRSNTLFFETQRNWRGLLIEADPKNFDLIIAKHRRVYMSPTCLAPSTHPISVKFQQQNNMGHIIGEFYNPSGNPEIGKVLEVQCFPLLSYLKALNVTKIDYFSLDVEGAEFSILKTIPWNLIDIKTLSVEFIHDKADKYAIQEYMDEQGYFLHSEVTAAQWLANDFIFVKKELQSSLSF